MCPSCGKPIEIDDRVFINCSTYNNLNLAVSKCCGAGFLVKAVEKYNITPYTGDRKIDSWGNPIKKHKNIIKLKQRN